jgi:hypothetical protein
LFLNVDRFAIDKSCLLLLYEDTQLLSHIGMPSLAEEKLNNLCKEILQLDNSTRFIGIANNLGSLVATAYRNGLIPLMNKQETSHYAIQAVLRAATREDFESKIGRLEYSIGKYERLIRATIPIRLFGKEDESKSYYLLLSFDLNSNVMDVIENKVMPFIQKNREQKL